ncbi:hypothetical protein UZ36_05935 [Candidatus Nitromaritima sp. SCGC AAA799-C22]|nr:hypothetical protein UZ36_05935 [Candidatus Nitromaritima sp. SCGC AAA799-C22]
MVFLLFNTSSAHAVLKSYEAWMGTYYHGKKLGFAHVKLKIGPEETVANMKVYFRMMSEGVDQSTTFIQETHLTPDLKLKNFSLVQELMGSRQKIEARVRNGKLEFEVASPDFRKKDSIDFPPAMAPSATYLLNMVRSGLTVGKKGTVSVFVEPFQMVVGLKYKILRKEKADLDGKPVDAYVIHQNMSGMESTFWITADGIVLREESPQGFTSVRETESVATELGDEAFPASRFITLSLVKPQHEIEGPRERGRLKFKMSGMDALDLIPKDHRQKVTATEKLSDGNYASTITIESEKESTFKALSLPVPVKASDRVRLLGDSPSVQVNHPQIRALSRLLSEGQTDSWRVARIINRWVFDNMEKALVDTVTAVDALRERRGECQSHTYLFTALARAAGIPTKVVNGLVYSEDYGGFLYHAWPEVYVGQWRALDPTLGQERVDATHIKLTENEREDPFKLMKFVGRVSIEIIEK